MSPSMERIVRGACYFFLIGGAAALCLAGFVTVESRAYQTAEMKKFEQARVPEKKQTLAEGDVIGEIEVPRLEMKAMVVQGDTAGNLRRAVAHLSNTAMPGEWGNVTLAGHRDTFFRPLSEIHVGDEIKFKTAEQSFEYAVESFEIVGADDVEALDASTGRELTLVTCYPFHYVGAAPKRFVVRAREIYGTLRAQIAN